MSKYLDKSCYTPVLAKIAKYGVVSYKKLNASGYIGKSAKTLADIFDD
jgi:hypothetical protein